MRTYVGNQEAWNAYEFEELACGVDRELIFGSPYESPEERAARMDAARDILADDPVLYRRAVSVLVSVVPLMWDGVFDRGVAA